MPAYLSAAPDGLPWLSILIFWPIAGLFLLWASELLPLSERSIKRAVVIWMLVPLAIVISIWLRFDPNHVVAGQGAIQFVERFAWVRSIEVNFFLGVDGISLPLVFLTVIMAPIAALASFSVEDRYKSHFALLLLLESAMLGYFLALDFFFFFIFWEFSLVPAFVLIQLWGREERRSAAFTFFVYTVSGSLGMLLLFQVFYLATRSAGAGSFDLITLGRLGQGLPTAGYSADLQTILYHWVEQVGLVSLIGGGPQFYSGIAFWCIFIAFAIKLAVWPFHTWLPNSYSSAPTAGSIMLAAVMSKMGAYGMLRILLPFVPDAARYFAPVMGALALVSVVAGAFGALSYVNGDLKRLIAYTSINHMGYVMLAIAAAAAAGAAQHDSRTIAINGALLQMVAHGLSTGALFLLAGALAKRTGSYLLSDFGGLRARMPAFAGVMGVALFANLGLPGLAGFMGEFLIFRGAWASMPFFTILASIGLLISALALLLAFQRIFLGPISQKWQHVSDLDLVEWTAALPLLALLLIGGIYPAALINLSNATVYALVEIFARAV
jgi:NADH-quinone oxidoreductase subunit M